VKVALIGSAPSSIRGAPYQDTAWKIYACSPGTYGVITRVDEFFETHLWEPGQPWFSPEYVQWMTALPKRGATLWVGGPVPGIPDAKLYPFDDVLAAYDPRAWFCTSSLFWMMARAMEAIRDEAAAQGRAIDRDFDKIALYGVDMAACTSYDTKVLTADLRWVRSDEVKVGDYLIGFDEHATPGVGGLAGKRRWQAAEVLMADRLTKPCYKVTLEDGRELICSENHKWLTHAENECRWKLTSELMTRYHRVDRPTHIVKLFDEVWTENRSWDAGYVAAAFDGEGHLSQVARGDGTTTTLGFAQRQNAMSREVMAACARLGVDFGVASGDPDLPGECFKHTVRGGRPKVMEFLGKIRPRRLLEKFDPTKLGIMQKVGTVAVVKTEFIGEYPVIGLKTSTSTFVAEGLASHNSEEYEAQRSGIHFMTYKASDMGIEVGVPPESDLFTPRFRYGADEWTHSFRKMRARRLELEQRKQHAEQQLKLAEAGINFLSGAIDDLKYCHDTWADKRTHLGITPDPVSPTTKEQP
jgi:hypothetical protein